MEFLTHISSSRYRLFLKCSLQATSILRIWCYLGVRIKAGELSYTPRLIPREFDQKTQSTRQQSNQCVRKPLGDNASILANTPLYGDNTLKFTTNSYSSRFSLLAPSAFFLISPCLNQECSHTVKCLELLLRSERN